MNRAGAAVESVPQGDLSHGVEREFVPERGGSAGLLSAPQVGQRAVCLSLLWADLGSCCQEGGPRPGPCNLGFLLVWPPSQSRPALRQCRTRSHPWDCLD